jgi:hypothetical protein
VSHAPKKFDVIPSGKVAALQAYEGLVREALDNLNQALRECLRGSENPYHWIQLQSWTDRLNQRHRALQGALADLARSQGKG